MRARTRIAAASGVTLLELLVTLAVLGVMLAVAGLAFGRLAEEPDAAAVRTARVAAVRRRALTLRRPVAFTVEVDGVPVVGTAHPDGHVVAERDLGLDPLSGAPHAASR